MVDLKEAFVISERKVFDGIPCIYYDILLHNTKIRIGTIDLRLKMDMTMFYYGHVGYTIEKAYRGHSYAYWACKKLFEIAKEEYGMSSLLITCSPDNLPSYKTIEKLHGQYLGTFNVPHDHELYYRNERIKCVFRFDL